MTAAHDLQAQAGLAIELAGELVRLLPQGALWWADRSVLVVSDLHFEKGSFYAAGGQMLPPYDTSATLSQVESLVAAYQPETCLSLGDSFHDVRAELRLDASAQARIKTLTSLTDWIWVEGNHDPAPPALLGGRAEKTVRLGCLVFRHEPTGEVGEVAGHLHPVSKVVSRGRSVRTKCFAADNTRLIMPALGALTGGLNVLDDAFSKLFPCGLRAHALGADGVYTLAGKRLVGDRRNR